MDQPVLFTATGLGTPPDARQSTSFPSRRDYTPIAQRGRNPAGEPHDTPRPAVQGKFFQIDSRRFDVCGVTYGPFSGPDGLADRAATERDFAQMRASGINTIRVYIVPPRWMLDLAQQFGLFVMIGVAWEQHVAFLDDASLCSSIEDRVRKQVRSVAGHPAILCFIIGNEISPSIVRWHGPARVERFIKRLYLAAKAEDPGALVTYANFPSTQYLRLPFLDFVSFNVYLENRDELARYLVALHHEAEERPLLLTEVGLDSKGHGQATQAHVLNWQVRTAFAEGCAGVVLFSWTDEWHCAGGADVQDWEFGLTSRQRVPKPALDAVAAAFGEMPFDSTITWPGATVVVCTYNGSRTLAECLDGVTRLQYPDLQVIVVDDGSTDSTPQIIARFGGKVQVIRQENCGLSAARNAGLKAATGEIVAYLDDDARPDQRWLNYLVLALLRSENAGVGGPNLPCPEDPVTSACVSESPGLPTHVMLDDRTAEHIPGCNMAFRKRDLQAIGGFDPQFWIAGDDVDICWRLQEHGFKLGFAPAAVVWHHRRGSVGGYLRQQVNYGRAEAQLERKWPHKYNISGHVAWAGRVYARGPGPSAGYGRRDIFYGTWGAALFQKAHPVGPSILAQLPAMPEWYLAMALSALLSLLGLLWKPLLIVAVPALLVTAGFTLLMALGCFYRQLTDDRHAARPSGGNGAGTRAAGVKAAALIAFLHVMQPVARFWGRTCGGLTPWRFSEVRPLHGHPNPPAARRPLSALPRTRTLGFWSVKWKPHVHRLSVLKESLRDMGVAVRCGGEFDRWDLEVRGGAVATARVWTSVEEHGNGRQLTIVRVSPRWHLFPVLLTLLLLAGALIAWHQSKGTALFLTAAALTLFLRGWHDAALASGAVQAALKTCPDLGKPSSLVNRSARPQGIESPAPAGGHNGSQSGPRDSVTLEEPGAFA